MDGKGTNNLNTCKPGNHPENIQCHRNIGEDHDFLNIFASLNKFIKKGDNEKTNADLNTHVHAGRPDGTG